MKISSSFSLFRASCRIRTNDPEITAEKIHFSPITIGRIPVKEVLLCTY